MAFIRFSKYFKYINYKYKMLILVKNICQQSGST